MDAYGNRQWCCTQEAVSLGMCDKTYTGMMIVDPFKYKGEHRFVSVPFTGDYVGTVDKPIMTTKSSGSGQYTLIIANCNDFGRDVKVEGQYIFKSKGGYLPGAYFDEWHFITFLMVCYILLFAWYGLSMKSNRESIIQIQKWIFATICLGLVEQMLGVLDYACWNADGVRTINILYGGESFWFDFDCILRPSCFRLFVFCWCFVSHPLLSLYYLKFSNINWSV